MINVYAASLVPNSLSKDFNLAAVLIQVSWIVIGPVGITLRWRSLLLAKRQSRGNKGRAPARGVAQATPKRRA